MASSDKKLQASQAITASDFKKYPRYTTTSLAAVNWKIDRVTLFKYVNFVKLDKDPFVGVKRTNVKLDIPDGSILQVKYKDAYKIVRIRGYGQDDAASKKCFGNSLTIVMYVGKIVVIKVPSRGKIQIVGCRVESQVHKTLRAIWKEINRIAKTHPEVVRIPANEVPKIIFCPVMNNINMNIGFRINKRKVQDFLYQDTEFHIIPNDTKYAGVTAKLEVEGLEELPMVKFRFLKGRWYESKATWIEYLSMLNAKDRKKEENTERYQTFLIFHSGKVIQSGPRYELMEDMFVYFVRLMNTSRSFIEDTTTERAGKGKSKTDTTIEV